jgi:hypothetical protein
MIGLFTPLRIVAASVVLLASLFAVGWATRNDPNDKPVIAVLGGGFIFNYRIADNYYGFTAVVQKPLEAGSIIEASFEDPGGGAPHVLRERVSAATNRYDFRTPPLSGIEAEKPYKVVVRVLDREETAELYSTEVTYRSNISDANMPKAPLTIGPGYARNPQAGG